MEKQKTEGIQLPNGWESVGVIGKGSFGVVYKAKRVIGRNIEWAAVKHISMPADPDDLNQICAELGTANEATINAYLYESLQDMLGEYFQMKSLQGNTNIVACHDIQQIPKANGIGYDVFIWMELLDSLSKRTIDGKMNREEVVRMGLDICQALSLLCSKGIVHRDIKPQNIFVNERGDYKLGDFGSARGIKGTSTILTMKGTFSYMAPEIMQGRPANFTSDIYSLGLVMYRLLNRNRHPFMQEGEVSSARVIEESNYRRLGGEALPMPVDADEELGRIILKACAYEPRNRWQTPEEMYNALAALGEETIKRVFTFDRPPVTDQPNKEQEIKTVTASTITPQEESTSKMVEKPPQPTLEKKASVPPVYMAPKSDANEKKNRSKQKKIGIVISVAAICVLLVVAAVFALKNWDRGATAVANASSTNQDATIKANEDNSPSNDSGQTSSVGLLISAGAVGEYDVTGSKIGVILYGDENSNATYEQIEGIRTAIRNLGIAEPEWRYNIPEIDDEVYNTATELVEQGCNIIFASGFGFETGMVQAAAEHPDVIYVIYEGEQANVCGLSNVVNVYPRIYESRYVSGVVAGMKLKELLDMGLIQDPHVGYVDTFGGSYEVSSYTAFFLGVRSIVPNAHMDVMYTESWYDPYRSSAAAQTLMEKGCIIICQGLTRDTGVASAVEEAWKNDKAHFSVGYAEDYSSIAPNSLLTVAQANMSAHYQSVLIDFMNGKKLAHDYALGYEADGVIISGLGLACAPGTAEKVEEVIDAIKTGDLHVFDISTFTVNGSTVNTEIVDFSVTDYATDRKYAGEKLETIFDGYFHESFYRSAPYFYLRIDGITELN